MAFKGHSQPKPLCFCESCVCRHRHWHIEKHKITPTARQSGPLSTRPVLKEMLTATEGEKPSVWELHTAPSLPTKHSLGAFSHTQRFLPEGVNQ